MIQRLNPDGKKEKLNGIQDLKKHDVFRTKDDNTRPKWSPWFQAKGQPRLKQKPGTKKKSWYINADFWLYPGIAE